MSLNKEARLLHSLLTRVHEREKVMQGLPEEVQFFILSKSDYK